MSDIQSTLTDLLTKANENASSIKELKTSTAKTDKDLHKKLDDYISNNMELKQELILIDKRVAVLEGEVAELKTGRAEDEKARRQLIIVIKGVPEVKLEKLYMIMSKLLETLGASFNYTATNGAFRVGKIPMGGIENIKFPRIIKLKLATCTRQQKSEMFGRRAEFNKIRGYEKIFFANDMSEEELLTYREVKQIHNAAAALDGVESKI